MGRFLKAVTGYWSIGGTGQPYLTDRANDVVYASPWDVSEQIGGVTVNSDKALNFIPFYAAVKIISEDVAGLPLNVYRKLPNGGREVDEGHWLQPLLHDQPNPEMTAFTWRETAMAHVLTWGNHYSEIEYASDGSILNLWPLRPDSMQVVRKNGQLVYVYRINGVDYELKRKQVFHLHGLGYDGRIGYSVVDRLRRSLALGIAVETHGTNGFANGMIPPAKVTYPGKLSNDARRNLRESMEGWKGLDNRQRIAILEEGLDVSAIGIPNDDAQFIATLDYAGGAMATAFRIPPHMLGLVTKSTSWGTGIEQQKIGYVTSALRGWLVRSEQQYKSDLLTRDDDQRYVRHVVDGFLRGDTAQRWQAYNAGLDRGVWSIDDVLAMEDRNPLPEGLGQRHFVPLNMVPLDQVGEMTMEDRLTALAQMTTAGIPPNAAADVAGVPLAETEPVEPDLASTNGSR